MLVRNIKLKLVAINETLLENFNERFITTLRNFSTDAVEFDRCISQDMLRLLVLKGRKPILSKINLNKNDEILVEIGWLYDFRLDLKVNDEILIEDKTFLVSEVHFSEQPLPDAHSKAILIKTISPILIKEPFPTPINLLEKYADANIINRDILNHSWISGHKLKGKKIERNYYLLHGIIRLNFAKDINVSLLSTLGVGLMNHKGFGSILISMQIT